MIVCSFSRVFWTKPSSNKKSTVPSSSPEGGAHVPPTGNSHPPGRAISRRSCHHLAMPQMSDDFTSILTNAGGVFLVPYLTARGITTVALLARAAATEDALVAGLVTPFISGWQASDGTTLQANAYDALLAQAAFTVAWEDARVARALALAPVASAQAPAASPQHAAERPERVPTNLLPVQWSAPVDAYNSRYAPAIRALQRRCSWARRASLPAWCTNTRRRANSPRSSWGRSSANAHSARMARRTASRWHRRIRPLACASPWTERSRK